MKKALIMHTTAEEMSEQYWKRLFKPAEVATEVVPLEGIEAQLRKTPKDYFVCMPYDSSAIARRLFNEHPSALILLPRPPETHEVMLMVSTHITSLSFKEVLKL